MLLDIQKVFDCLDYGILFQKLGVTGVTSVFGRLVPGKRRCVRDRLRVDGVVSWMLTMGSVRGASWV